MILWLSRARDGKYMVTKFKPLLMKLEGFDHTDFYIVPGDPVGYRGMCSLITPLLGIGLSMPRLSEPKLVEIKINLMDYPVLQVAH